MKSGIQHEINEPIKTAVIIIWLAQSFTIHVTAHDHPSIFTPTRVSEVGWREGGPGTWQVAEMVEKVLSLSSALCVTFTSKVGAKGDSDGQLVCNTLHGVVRQPWQRFQFLPGVGGRWDAFLRAAEQHNIAPDVQGALDLTCWHGRGHWQGERVSDITKIQVYQGCIMLQKKTKQNKTWRSHLKSKCNRGISENKIVNWKEEISSWSLSIFLN